MDDGQPQVVRNITYSTYIHTRVETELGIRSQPAR